MWPIPQFAAELVTFTEEILNGKLHFLCSEISDIIHLRNKILYIEASRLICTAYESIGFYMIPVNLLNQSLFTKNFHRCIQKPVKELR